MDSRNNILFLFIKGSFTLVYLLILIVLQQEIGPYTISSYLHFVLFVIRLICNSSLPPPHPKDGEGEGLV